MHRSRKPRLRGWIIAAGLMVVSGAAAYGARLWLDRLGEKPFRAGQLAEWIFKKRATSFEAMTDLPAAFRKALAEKFKVRSLEIDSAKTSDLDGTTRYFFKTADGAVVFRHAGFLNLSQSLHLPLR